MTPFFNIVQPALWKVTRHLVRDYRELEQMRLGNCLSIDKFAIMSTKKVREIIQKEIYMPSYKSIIFNSTKLPDQEGSYILVQDLESIENFKKSLPFFGSLLVCIEHSAAKTQAIASYVTFPALGYGFYAELGQGAWGEKYGSSDEISRGGRLRTSGIRDLSQTIVNKDLKEYDPNFNEVRDFGSYLYDMVLFLMGKIDGTLVPSNHLAIKYALELFANETGAYFTTNHKGDGIVVSQGLAPNYSKKNHV
ncbi:MAG: hypothetical protein SFT68_05235 [Rickettsiaceae bacterium]|nr:hypothetical protein [Rickettsiaceae bacterium]